MDTDIAESAETTVSFLDRIPVRSQRERSFFMSTVILTFLMFILDWGTKELAVRLIKPREMVEVIPGFFNLVHVLNFGAAFGQFKGMGNVLLIFSAVVFLGIVIFFRKWAEGCPERFFALGLILSGILGNALDRLMREPAAVVDLLDFHLGANHWPAFNVADSAICIGAAVIIVSSFIRKSPEPAKK